MNREHRILAGILTSKEFYSQVSYLLQQRDFTEQGWEIIETAVDYYERDSDASSIDQILLSDVLSRKYPRQAELLSAVVGKCYETEISLPNARQDYLEMRKEATRDLLAAALTDNDQSSIDELMESYQNCDTMLVTEEEATFYEDADIEDVISVLHKDNLIPVFPKSINDRIDGGLIPGTQTAIYAPTESGKSMLAINIAAGMCHSGKRVLYCGNEDPAKAMLLRFYSRFSGMDKSAIIEAPEEARNRAVSAGFKNLVFYDMAPGSVPEVRKAIDKYKPDVVFVDQMANMWPGGSYSKVEKNEILATRLRTTAKNYDVAVVVIHQASDDAYGKLRVEKNDLYFSNVGVQGQMDVMIGIGMDSAYEQQNMRMLCLTKNKLSGNHECWPVRVQPELSKVMDDR